MEDFRGEGVRHFFVRVGVEDGSWGMGNEIELEGLLYFGSSTRRGVEVIFFEKVGGVEVFVIDP
jgi:hypothetical protein